MDMDIDKAWQQRFAGRIDDLDRLIDPGYLCSSRHDAADLFIEQDIHLLELAEYERFGISDQFHVNPP